MFESNVANVADISPFSTPTLTPYAPKNVPILSVMNEGHWPTM